MPKFIQNDEVLVNVKATKEFTDREEPRKIFWEKYNLMKSQMNDEASIQVISYYGFGGIGKTSLLHKLMEEVNDREPESKIEFLDFEKLVEFNNNLLDVLKVIRQDLKDKYKFTFPIFDLVTYVYETKMGKTATKPELSSIFDENKELGFLKDVISDIPLIGTFAKVIYYADAGKNLIQDRLRNRKLRERLLEIENASVEDIKEHLAYYFSIDLKENLKNEKRPFVFFIDTYEKLVNELTQVGDPLKNDLWLRSDEGLICRVPNVIWVIAGREKLKWQDLDESWKGTLEQHLLGTLSFQDTSSFLKTAGIEQDELIKQIFNLTHGTPMYLDMCIDTYVKLREQGKEPTIEDFGGDTTKLVNRFLMYMKDAERDFSTMLAYVPEWTDESIEEISMKMNGTFSYSLYEKVKNFSFIVNENGKYKMHESIKDIIIANTPEMLRSKYQRVLQENENEKIEKVTQEENKRIESILKSENILRPENSENADINKIAYLDKYESKKAYKQLIENLRVKVIDEKDENEFNETAKFLLDKLNEYEEKFNETIKLKDMYLAKFKDNKYYKLLQVYRGDKVSIDLNVDKYIQNYNEWIKEFGENDKWALFEIKHLLRWNTYPITRMEEAKKLFDFVSSKLEKDNLYYISLCALCLYNNEGKQQEFIERIRAYLYNHEPDKFFMKLMLMASNRHHIDGALMEKYDDWGLTFYTDYYEKYMCEANNIAITNFNIAIKTLKDNPNLLDENILGQIWTTYESFLTDFENPLAHIAFDYMYGVRYIALSTSNQEIINNYIYIFRAFLGGGRNEKGSIIKDKSIIDKIIGFMKELKEHYIELYGKNHYNVNELEDYIDKFDVLTPETFNERIQSRINQYGIKDSKTIRTFQTYIREIGNRAQKEGTIIREIDEKYFDYIFDYIKKLLLNCTKEEINSSWMEGVLDDAFNCLQDSSYEKYHKYIWEIDKILLDAYEEKNGNIIIAGKVFKDVITTLNIGYEDYSLRNKEQTKKAIELVESIFSGRYPTRMIDDLLLNYIIFRTYYFIEKLKNVLEENKLIDKCIEIQKSFEHVVTYNLLDAFRELYNDLIGKEKIEVGITWENIKKYVEPIEKMKEFSSILNKNDVKVSLLEAYIGLLEIPLYMKEGIELVKESIKKANTNERIWLEEIEGIKQMEEKSFETYNVDSAINVSLDYILKKAEEGMQLPYV